MLVRLSVVFTIVVTFGESKAIPGVITTEQFDRALELDNDGKYFLFWNSNDTHVTFEVHVKTRGYVGFGISGNGSMFPADVIMAWVKDGVTHFADRHATSYIPPVKDKSQDWHLLHGEENDFGTVLKFVRRIDTCDINEDIAIQEDTVWLIYSYNDIDPADDDSITYHGTNRGTKSVSLLSQFEIPDNLPTDIRHYDFLNSNYLVPNDSFTYLCKGFQVPDIGKHHMIKYEPLVTPGNELMVNHILIYRCPIAASYDGVQGLCNTRDRPLPHCNDVILTWAIGGKPFYFPSETGFAFGASDEPSFYIMQTHYDNPTQKAGVIDNSGIRLTLTKTLRPKEVSLLEIGHRVSYEQIIPPYQKAFVSKAYCSQGCIQTAMSMANLSEIRIIGALQHAHQLGTGIKTRHFRNGVELEPLEDDPDYDFKFQEMQLLKKERVIYLGDSFSVECTYDSRGRSHITFGGLSTKNEMCLTFAYYYPKLPVANCLSVPVLDTKESFLFWHELYNYDWRDSLMVTQFIQRVQIETVRHTCQGLGINVKDELFREQETDHPYQSPVKDCSAK